MADREFIAAKDLPVTEAEEVNVLVVDPSTGELAQKAGANMGGEKTDMVIAFTAPAFGLTPTSENTSATIESGSLNAVVDALREGRPPVVKCKRFYVTNDFDTSFPIVESGTYDCDVVYYGGRVINYFISSSTGYAIKIVYDINDDSFLEVYLIPFNGSIVQII